MAAEISQEHEKCISCGACVAVCPMYFEMGSDGKAHIKGAKGNKLKVKEAGCAKDAENACPVQIIHVKGA